MEQNLCALAFRQGLLGQRGQQVEVGVVPGGFRLQSRGHAIGYLIHVLL
jgi:hypothetical protein